MTSAACNIPLSSAARGSFRCHTFQRMPNSQFIHISAPGGNIVNLLMRRSLGGISRSYSYGTIRQNLTRNYGGSAPPDCKMDFVGIVSTYGPSRQHLRVLEESIPVNSVSRSTLNRFMHSVGLSQIFEMLPRDFANLRPEPESFQNDRI